MKKINSFFSFLICNLLILTLGLAIALVIYTQSQSILASSIANHRELFLTQLKAIFDEEILDFNKITSNIRKELPIASLTQHLTPLSKEDIYKTYQINTYLANCAAQFSSIDSIWVYFPSSELMITNQSCYSNFDEFIAVTESDMWTSTHLNEMISSTTRLSYFPNPYTSDLISVVVPFESFSNKVNSPYIILNINSTFLTSALNEHDLLSDYHLFIFDHSNKLLFDLSSQPNFIFPSSDPTFEEVLNLPLHLDATRYSTTQVTSTLLGWTYFFITPTYLIAPATLDLLYVICLMLLIGLSLALCVILARKNYDPIQKLVQLVYETTQTLPTPPSTNEFDLIASSLLTNHTQYVELQEVLTEKLPDLKNQALDQLLKGTVVDWEHFDLELHNLGIDFPHKGFYVFSLEIIPYTSSPLSLLTVTSLSLQESMLTFFPPDTFIYSLLLSPSRLACIVNTAQPPTAFYPLLTKIHGELISKVNQMLPASLTLGCSPYETSIKQIPLLHDQALKSLEHQLITLPNELCIYDTLACASSNYTFYYPAELESKLISHIKLGHEDYVLSLITDIILHNTVETTLSLEASKCLFFNIMATAIKTINMLSLDTTSIFSTNPYEQLLQCSNLADMEVLLRELFVLLCRHIHETKSETDVLGQQLLAYIEENFSNADLDLTHLSHHFNLSTNYLSRYLKEHTGHNFMTYITQIRLSHAQSLLRESSSNIKEIATLCGYRDSAGLIRNFKKVFDITPGQYRDSLDLDNKTAQLN